MNSRTYAAYAAMRAHQRKIEEQQADKKKTQRLPLHKVVLKKETTELKEGK